MSEKIQTEFAEFVVRKLERDPERHGYRPPKCKLGKMCLPMGYDVGKDGSYFCCGVALTDDEDIVVLCARNSASHQIIWSRFTIPEAMRQIELLSHLVYECTLIGMPEYGQVMKNWVQELKALDGRASNFGHILSARRQ